MVWECLVDELQLLVWSSLIFTSLPGEDVYNFLLVPGEDVHNFLLVPGEDVHNFLLVLGGVFGVGVYDTLLLVQ